MKKKVFLAAGGLTLVTALGHFGAKPLMAQIRAALVKNIDERGRSPYTVMSPCTVGETSECTASFPQVPANKRRSA